MEQRLVEKKKQYDKMVSFCEEERAQKEARRQTEVRPGDDREGGDGDHEEEHNVLPLGEGSLIIDEVKVHDDVHDVTHLCSLHA